MTTRATYLEDLQVVLGGGGQVGQYLVRWWPVREMTNKPPLFTLLDALRQRPVRPVRRYDLALYDITASRGTSPLVLVPVDSEEPVPQLGQRQEVSARGTVEVGRAIVVATEGHEFRPIGPATLPVFLLRRYRL